MRLNTEPCFFYKYPNPFFALTACVLLSTFLHVSFVYAEGQSNAEEERAQVSAQANKKQAKRKAKQRQTKRKAYNRAVQALPEATSDTGAELFSKADELRGTLLALYAELPPTPSILEHVRKRFEHCGALTPEDEATLLRCYGPFYPLNLERRIEDRLKTCRVIDLARNGNIKAIVEVVRNLHQDVEYFPTWTRIIGKKRKEVTEALFARFESRPEANAAHALVHTILSLRLEKGEALLTLFKTHHAFLDKHLSCCAHCCKMLAKSVSVDDLFAYSKEVPRCGSFSAYMGCVKEESGSNLCDDFVRWFVQRLQNVPPYLLGYETSAELFLSNMRMQAFHKVEADIIFSYREDDDSTVTFIQSLLRKQVESKGNKREVAIARMFLATVNEFFKGATGESEALAMDLNIPLEIRMVAGLRAEENRLGISGHRGRSHSNPIRQSEIGQAYKALQKLYKKAHKKKEWAGFSDMVLFRIAQIELGVFGERRYLQMDQGLENLERVARDSSGYQHPRYTDFLLSYYLGQISDRFTNVSKAKELLEAVTTEDPITKRMFGRKLCEVQMGLFGEEHQDFHAAVAGRTENGDHEYLYLIYSGVFGEVSKNDQLAAALYDRVDEETAVRSFPYLAFLKARDHYYKGNLERSVALLEGAVDRGFYFACIPLISYHLHRDAPIREVLRLILNVQKAGLLDQFSGRFLEQLKARKEEVVEALRQTGTLAPLRPYLLPGLTEGGEGGSGDGEEIDDSLSEEEPSSDEEEVEWKESGEFQTYLQEEEIRKAQSPTAGSASSMELPGLFSCDRALEADMDRLRLGQITQVFLLKLLAKLGANVVVSEGSTLKFRITLPGNEKAYGFHNVHYGNHKFKMKGYWARLKAAMLQRYQDILKSEGGCSP